MTTTPINITPKLLKAPKDLNTPQKVTRNTKKKEEKAGKRRKRKKKRMDPDTDIAVAEWDDHFSEACAAVAS